MQTKFFCIAVYRSLAVLLSEVITNADETDKNQARVLDIIILLLLHVNNKDRNNPRPMVHGFKKNRNGFERRFALEAVKIYKSPVLCPKLFINYIYFKSRS
jgi:hypothetical protein